MIPSGRDRNDICIPGYLPIDSKRSRCPPHGTQDYRYHVPAILEDACSVSECQRYRNCNFIQQNRTMSIKQACFSQLPPPMYLCSLCTAVHNSAPIKTQAKKPPDSLCFFFFLVFSCASSPRNFSALRNSFAHSRKSSNGSRASEPVKSSLLAWISTCHGRQLAMLHRECYGLSRSPHLSEHFSQHATARGVVSNSLLAK
jgi:hypothetical protein